MSEAAETPTADGEKLSKNALKKLQKDKEKAEKKAAAKKAEQNSKATAEMPVQEDTAKGNYGELTGEVPTSTNLRDLTEANTDQEVTLVAHVHNARSQSAKLAFLMLRQQGETIQAVLAAAGENVSRQMVKWAAGLHVESVVRVSGLVKKPATPVASATISEIELHVTRIYLIEEAPEMIPIQVKDLKGPNVSASGEETQQVEGEAPIVTLATRLDSRHIDLRAKYNQAIISVNHRVVMLFLQFLDERDFRLVPTPKLLGAATEGKSNSPKACKLMPESIETSSDTCTGGSSVFEVKYFEKRAFLAQSPQFYKQMLISGDCERVMEVAPVFRAENSNTHRHMTEFTGLDFEMVFDKHYHEVLDLAENLIIFIVRGLQKRCKAEIDTLREYLPKAGDFRIPEDGKALRLTYLEGIKILKDSGEDTSKQDSFETDLTTAQEKRLGELIREKYNTDFYVLDEFPMAVRPFYTKAHPTNKDLSNSYDFFMRGEEIMSGAQRINNAEELMASMKAKGADPTEEGFQDYINAFRHGCRPHAGGGLGLNRIVQFFLGLPNIRQATAFPRDPVRLAP